MLPIKKILCPVDFSEFSFRALAQATELATHFKAELFVLHVTQPIETIYQLGLYAGTPSWDIQGYERELRQGAERELVQLLEAEQFRRLEVHPLLRAGLPADQIVEAAHAVEADLLVISTHGLGGWHHLLFGSVAEKVIRMARCPVLISRVPVPEEA